MSEKRRIPLADAEQLAAELVELLSPACERIEIAGSIRRRRPTIGDIELVMVPRLVAVSNLFGQPTGAYDNDCDFLLGKLRDKGTLPPRLDVNGRRRWGTRYKAATYKGFGCDLFSVLEPAQWGTIFLIRTGSAEFSHRLVTQRRQGGCMPAWMQERDGALWSHGELVPTPEEADVFEALGLPFVEPHERTESWRPVGSGVR